MEKTLEKIYKVGLKFLAPLTPQELHQLIVKEAMKLVNAHAASIFMPDLETHTLTRVYSSDSKLYPIQIRKKGITYKTFKTGRPQVIAKTKLLYRIQPKFRKMGIKSIISIPLSNKDQTTGVLSLQSRKVEHFTKKELDILKLFGSVASLALRKTQLYEEVNKAVEARDLFIAMAAHELRTPLTTISGYSQLLYSRFKNSNRLEATWIANLSWEILRLTNLVNELLEVQRIKSGRLQYVLKECSLREIVSRALSEFRFVHPHHKIILEDKLKNGNDKIIGDSDKILQMVINLLDNAAKYSSSGSEITIELKAKRPHIILKVKDQGKGISKKDLSGIFEKFHRGTSHTVEGMGLGLFLVKNIINQHHGDIKISSRENKGTKVEVTLPRANT